MDRETHIQIDRIEQKLDYIINLLEEPIEEKTEEQEEDETPEEQLEGEDEQEKEMQRKGILIKKTIRTKQSELKE